MLWSYLKTADKPILLYGMGNGAEKILDRLELLDIPVSGVFASDGFARHNTFRGYTVISYSEAREIYGDMIALIAFGSQRKEVLDLFKKMQGECELYAPDVPVYGDTVFDKAFENENRARLASVCDRLCDEQSKLVFENTVKYKLTGDISYLFACETAPGESYENIIKPDNETVYLDLGAYTGDTVFEFIENSRGYKRIIAVEPDIRSFKKLSKNIESLHNIEALNIGIHSRREDLPFSMSGGRQSVISDHGMLIHCDSVDNILSGDGAGFIKLDVEGQEKEALMGCRETILKYKPKLCVAAYHRSEDYFEIPELVLSIRDDYKMYMRHFPYVPAWDTNFYFV